MILTACAKTDSSPESPNPTKHAGGTGNLEIDGEGLQGKNCGNLPYPCGYITQMGLTYPYPKEPTSYLFAGGAVFPYVERPRSATDLTTSARVRATDGTIVAAQDALSALNQPASQTPRTPIIGFGSNGAPQQLIRKFVLPISFTGSTVIPVTQIQLKDIDVTWSPHIAPFGAMPATVVNSPRTKASVWVTWLDADQLKRMHETEYLGDLYSYGTLSRNSTTSSAVALTEDPGMYVDCYGGFVPSGSKPLAVADVPATNRQFPKANSPQAMKQVAQIIGWKGSTFDLVADGVVNQQKNAERTAKIRTFSELEPVNGFTAQIPCKKN